MFINKGDMIAVYNAHMYVGKSISGEEYDCQFYQIDFKPTLGETFNPDRLYGDGSAGLLVYAHGVDPQRRLYLDIDLGHRYNIEKIEVKGEALNNILEYNIASCLDINWKCDLFGEQHWTSHANRTLDGFRYWYQRPNTYYGLDRLNDNLKTVPDGLACDSYSITTNGVGPWSEQIGGDRFNYSAGPGIVPTNPYYFWVNGDEEWLGVWLHAQGEPVSQAAHEFDHDPVALYLHFPFEKEKQIYKLKMYFKEKFNFRSFGLSTYRGFYDAFGNADDPHYDLIPEYNKIILDGVEFYEGSPTYYMVDDYLFNNPCTGHMIASPTSAVIYEWDPVYSDLIKDFSAAGGYGDDSGYFTTQTFEVDNPDVWNKARSTDWQIIQHEWEPITTKGFRIYCDFHKSTKITEMELYGVAEDIGSNLVGSIVMTFSDYEKIWWPTESTQTTDTSVEVFIGDSPRHLTLEIIPITETRYDDITIYVKTEDLYAGTKGCEYKYYADKAKTGVVNEGQLVEVKNVYDNPYDLYIDISPEKFIDNGLLFYSDLSSTESIENPVIGPDANYFKLFDYDLRNQDYNCAINCHTFGLQNLIDGATAYYSRDDMFNWLEWGQLSHGDAINFNNLLSATRTIAILPKLSRNRYWKFGFLNPDVFMNVREIRAYDDEGNLLDPVYYHDLNKTFTDAPVSERAPHLDNISIVGSYYEVDYDQYITMDLGEQVSLGRIELQNDGIDDYYNFHRTEDPIIGIDKYTKMCIRSWKDNTGSYLEDVSYYGHETTIYGSTYIDTLPKNVSLYKDFGCLTDWAEWKQSVGTVPGYVSEFRSASASGTVTSGVCEYPGYVEFDLYCSNRSNDIFWTDLREDAGTQALKIWQHLPFEITFKINVSNLVNADASYQASFCVGVFRDKQTQPVYGQGSCNHQYWRGAQMVFEPQRNRFGLAIRDNQEASPNNSFQVQTSSNHYTYTYTTGFNLNTDYYCKLTCYGLDNHRDTENILYRAEVWTDAIDGGNRIVNLTQSTSLWWEAYRFGIASCCFRAGQEFWRYSDCNYQNPPLTPDLIQGVITDLQLNIDTDIRPYPWKDTEILDKEKCSIRIPSGTNNYVKIENSTELDVRKRYHTHDFWVKFNTLPDVGERQYILEQYNYDNDTSTTRGWRIALYNTGSWYRWEWFVNKGADYGYSWSLQEYNGQIPYDGGCRNFNIVKDKWYFMVFATGKQYLKSDPYNRSNIGGFHRESFIDISGRAYYDGSGHYDNASIMYDMPGGSDIIIGKGLDGWICEPRISIANNEGGEEHGGQRYATSVLNYNLQRWQTPTKPYSRMYPFSFYTSDDNLLFNHYADVDPQLPVVNNTYLPYLYYYPDNRFTEKYNSYFVIDLGHRYDIDILRRYAVSNDHFIDREANVIYSNIDTGDPYEAFMTEPSFGTDDTFEGYGGELLDGERWYTTDNILGNEYKYLSMKNGRLEQRVDSNLSDSRFYSTFGIRGNFDIQVKLGKISAPNTFNWWATFRVDMSDEVASSYNDSSTDQTYVAVRMEYRSDTANPYYRAKFIVSDGGTIYSTHTTLDDNAVGLRIIRKGYRFYSEYYDNDSWHELDNIPVIDARGKDVWRIHFGLACSNLYPTTRIYWQEFKINSADKIVLRSHHWDARWVGIEMLNGDNASRYLNKLGIYPTLTNNVSPDNHNYNTLGWTDLGPSITGYNIGTNVALGATVSGSSFIGTYFPENITNGIISNERSYAWLSDNTSEQWLLIDLGEEKQIYRVKLYHGWSTDDSDFMAEDYRIESSLDNQSFTTQWTIIGNSSFTRTHDKADPFTARYIRMYITGYKANNRFYIKKLDGINYYEWHGACMREIEVYEYYGYDYISSEEWPIVAINLRDQFYIQGRALVGLYTEDTKTNWSNDASNFAWSDIVHQDPKKVSFSSFGAEPYYEQWVIIKRDTATYHNVDPTGDDYELEPDYLKHVIIKSKTKENPINYPWWWSSIISTVSRDFTMLVELSISSLKISYPDSTALDTVQFIEGSNWGVDSDLAFRDALGFRWYIEDVDKLDTTEGYVFFGGLDGTNSPQPVEYRWYLSTLSGTTALQTGWNRPFFRFKDADEVIYNENADPFSIIRPEIPEYTQWQTFGFKFKGKGEAFDMNIDGALLQRNHFLDSSKFDFGLYLSASDYLELRPDYTFVGYDIHRRFKNRSLFHFSNVANDIFGCVINSNGINIYYGNLATDMRAMIVTEFIVGAIDRLFHIAVVFSANGKNIGGNSSIKLYINGGLVATNHDPWSYSDEKLFKFTVGGKAPLAIIEHASSLETTSIDGVVSNLRIYNYCKSDFTDSMNNTFSANGNDLLLPAKMIEISQDNVTFHRVGDAELPFFYEEVPAGDTVQFYVRSTIPNGLTGKEDRTAGIVTSWSIGV